MRGAFKAGAFGQVLGLVGVVTLAAGCGGGGPSVTYGAAMAPTAVEITAAGDATAALGAGLFSTSSEPTAGGPGLADQLAATLGAEGAPTAALPAQVRGLTARALALDTPAGTAVTTLPEACVTVTGAAGAAAGSVVWSGCVVDVPPTQLLTSMSVRVDGRLDWSAATGTTSWSIREVVNTAMDSDSGPVQIDATITLAGAFTVGAGTIKGRSTTDASVTTRVSGFGVTQAFRTSLDADLTFTPDPAFCVTGGTLTLEQVWTKRPFGADPAAYPDQGWKFEWAGCGTFTVAHGT